MNAILHTIVTVAILAAYTTLTSLGHDANALLALLGGYLTGAAAQALPKKTP